MMARRDPVAVRADMVARGELVEAREGDTLRLTRGGGIVITKAEKAAAEASYSAEVEAAHGIDFGQRIGLSRGWRGILKRGGKTVASSSAFYGATAKASAKRAAERLRLQHLTHYRLTCRFLDEDQRAEAEAMRRAREESSARRKAFTADRVEMWRWLENMLEVEKFADPDLVRERARELVEKHRRAVADISADPENKRGGRAEVPAPRPVLVGGRRR